MTRAARLNCERRVAGERQQHGEKVKPGATTCAHTMTIIYKEILDDCIEGIRLFWVPTHCIHNSGHWM